MKTNISTVFGFTIIGIVSVTILAFVLLFIKNTTLVPPSEPIEISTEEPEPQITEPLFQQEAPEVLASRDEVFSISAEWKEISRKSFWDLSEKFNPKKPWPFPPIKFSYPSNWNFFCCEGLDYSLQNSVTPIKDSGQSYENPPIFRITQIALAGCKEDKRDCSIEEIVALNSKETFERTTKYLPKGAKILPKKYLKGLDKYAFSYSHTVSRDGRSVSYETHTIELEGHVVEFQFVRPELLDKETRDRFLDSIQYDK